MTDYVIEHGIPIMARKRRAREYKYAVLDKLEVTDSVLIDAKDVKLLSPTITYRSKRSGKKYTCRTVEGGVRVWRTL
jgi:hypothetical protein